LPAVPAVPAAANIKFDKNMSNFAAAAALMWYYGSAAE